MRFVPDIFAEVRLFPTQDGGRRGPTPAEVFGCPLNYKGKFFDMRLDLSEVGSLSPGSTTRVPLAFLSPGLILPRLSIGSQFTLWEGRTIGEGTVLELPSTPAA